jgi:hypothetical protein
MHREPSRAGTHKLVVQHGKIVVVKVPQRFNPALGMFIPSHHVEFRNDAFALAMAPLARREADERLVEPSVADYLAEWFMK